MANNGTNRSRKGRVKWVLLLVVVVSALAGGAWYYRRGHDQAPQYETAPVERRDVMQVVTATGTLNPVTNILVGCQVSGRISKIYVDFNSTVTNGQLVAQIDPRTYQAQVEQAKADLASAKANLELQQAEAKRSGELYTNRLISASDYDTAVATYDEAKASVQIKQASLDNAKANLGFCDILSPVDGVVLSRNIVVGQTVAASFSSPTLFEIANNLKQMQIDADIDEADIGGIRDGQKVDFTVDAYPNLTFHGIVSQVRNAPTNSNNVVTYDTVIGVTNSDLKLKPGMTANVSIVVADEKNVLTIPNSALRLPPEITGSTHAPGPQRAQRFSGGRGFGEGQNSRRGGRGGVGNGPRAVPVVYMLAAAASDPGGKLQPVKIKTGITDNIYTVVLSGLKQGEKVVTGLQIPGLSSNQGTRNPFAFHRHF